MRIYQRGQMDRGRSVVAFGHAHPELFADGITKQLMDEVETHTTELIGMSGEQTSAAGSAKVGTGNKDALVNAVLVDLVAMAKTARTIEMFRPATEEALPYDFVVPTSRADDVLVATAEAFYTNASKPAVNAKFLFWKMDADYLPHLRADLDSYEGLVQGRDDSVQNRKDDVVDQKSAVAQLIKAIGGLDTLMMNVLATQAQLYGSWKEASKLVKRHEFPNEEPKPAPPMPIG